MLNKVFLRQIFPARWWWGPKSRFPHRRGEEDSLRSKGWHLTFRNCYPKRWEMSIPGRRKRYSDKETQTDSCPPSAAQEHCAGRDYVNASGLWYSTVTHNVKHESFATDTKNQTDYDQTEYATVNMPTNKRNTTCSEEHSAYDYVLIN